MKRQITQSIKYKLLLHKAYFERGYAMLSYVKYIAILLGLNSVLQDDWTIMIFIMGGFAIFSYIVGMIWFRSGLTITEAEISNQYNYFMKEMRTKIK